MVAEEAWAEDLTLGPIKFTDIPIGEPDDADLVPGAEFQAALGIAALRRLDLIVDGPHYIAYLRPRQSSAPPYSHNRAGAVFLPPDFQRTNLFARVLEGSPAYRTGIRDGDEVLKVNGKDVPDWRTYGDSMESCCESPAGTELRFTLKRGETNFETTVVLHELLGPQR